MILLSVFFSTKAQVVTDTVSVGAGYTDEVWYSLENGIQGTQPRGNWDIAFSITGFTATIMTNSANGIQLWTYPNGDTSAWSSVDTTGMSAWAQNWNSDTSWALGAFSANASTSDPYDLGWGIYNQVTHYVIGDSLYVIQLANGDYKKLWIEQLASSSYYFKYANLDGTNEVSASIKKSDYASKNFAYYSLETGSESDREPATTDWDLVFTKYTTFIPTAYGVSGVLTNAGIENVDVRDVDESTYDDWEAQTFSTRINEIGYDWKTFDMGTFSYIIEDSTVYFVKAKSGGIWKLVFIGFGGSTDGNFIFTKEKIGTVGLEDQLNQTSATIALYPNPVSNGNVTVVYDLEESVNQATVKVYDVMGKLVYQQKSSNSSGLNKHKIDLNNIKAGAYIVVLEFDNTQLHKKLIVK